MTDIQEGMVNVMVRKIRKFFIFFGKVSREAPYLFFFFFYFLFLKKGTICTGYKALGAKKQKKEIHYVKFSHQLVRASLIFCLALMQTNPISSLKADFQF